MKRVIGNILATTIALIIGLATIWVSIRYLKQPQDFMDWLVDILAGVTTGTLAFFITWGHFQQDPVGEES